MQAIPVTPAGAAYTFDSLALAKSCDPLVDYLLLDTTLGDGQEEPVPGWLGITGKTHDWAVSRAIVEQCQSPVILAGGLNPDNVAAQMESGVVFGLTVTLKSEVTIKNGRVEQNNFYDHPLLRIHEMPKVETYIVESEENPTGIGEMGVPPVAPAVANAIFAATGKRIRHIPIRAEDLIGKN